MYFKLFSKSILKIGLETLFIEAAFIYLQCVFALQLIIETLFGNFYELVAALWPLYSIWYKWYEHLHKVIVFPFAQKNTYNLVMRGCHWIMIKFCVNEGNIISSLVPGRYYVFPQGFILVNLCWISKHYNLAAAREMTKNKHSQLFKDILWSIQDISHFLTFMLDNKTFSL